MDTTNVTAELERSIMHSLAAQKEQWLLSVMTHFAEPGLVGTPTKNWMEQNELVCVEDRTNQMMWVEQRGVRIGPAYSTAFPILHMEQSDNSTRLVATRK